MITTKKLQNNLTFLHKYIEGSNIVDVRVVLRAGQTYDHKVGVPAGTAHFLEHVVHEKTEKYPDRESLMKVISLKGGIRNASTSTNEQMDFFATVLKDEAESAADYVSQSIAHTILTNEGTEKHRSIIEQEFLSKFKDPQMKCWLAFRELCLKNTGLEYYALGDLDGIQKISREDLQKFYDERFRAENSVLSIYGDIPLEQATILAEKYFLGMKTNLPPSTDTRFTFEEYPETEINRNDVSKQFKQIEIPDKQAVVYFGGVNTGRAAKDFYPLTLLLHILAGDYTSILYKILRDEKHLLYAVSFSRSMSDTVGTHAFTLNIIPENIQESLNIIKNEVEKIAKGDIDEDRLVLVKTRTRAKEVFGLQTVQGKAANDCAAKLLFPNLQNADEYLEKIDAVTKDEIIEAAKYLKDHLNLLAVCSNTQGEYQY